MLFGVMAVNKYYGYYPTWGAALADLTNQGVRAPSRLPQTNLDPSRGPATLDGSNGYLQQAQRTGYTLRLSVTGPRTHITRVVYVYLPLQYFQSAYSRYRFPAIELLHGQPGAAQDWINLVGVTTTFDQLMARNQARPTVLVVPDANGGERISLQCLNQVRGPQDLTYLGLEVRDRIAHLLRVEPLVRPGASLVTPRAGSVPRTWACGSATATGSPACSAATSGPQATSWTIRSGRSARSGAPRRCGRKTPPLDTLLTLPPGAVLPRFWLGAGGRRRAGCGQRRAVLA